MTIHRCDICGKDGNPIKTSTERLVWNGPAGTLPKDFIYATVGLKKEGQFNVDLCDSCLLTVIKAIGTKLIEDSAL